MKSAVYIEDGVVQFVLTPESEFEKNMLKSVLAANERHFEVVSGSFYNARGGWVRHTEATTSAYYSLGAEQDLSLIVRVRGDK